MRILEAVFSLQKRSPKGVQKRILEDRLRTIEVINLSERFDNEKQFSEKGKQLDLKTFDSLCCYSSF